MRPPISASAGLSRRSVGPCGASPCSTPATEGRVKCYQKWAVGQFHDALARNVVVRLICDLLVVGEPQRVAPHGPTIDPEALRLQLGYPRRHLYWRVPP